MIHYDLRYLPCMLIITPKIIINEDIVSLNDRNYSYLQPVISIVDTLSLNLKNQNIKFDISKILLKYECLL